jgi:type IV fimbrial biogenesis protein FimT
MRQRGFSLVELMVAMAILVLLILAAMPGLGTWLDNTRIRNAGDSILTGLQMARQEAVRTNQNVSLWFVESSGNPGGMANDCALSNGSGSWVVSANFPAGHCADAVGTSPAMVVVTRGMGGDRNSVSVKSLQADGTTAGTTVTFNGFGRVANSDAVAVISLNGSGSATYRNLRIWVSPSGSAQMCDPAVSATTDPRVCPAKPAPAAP